MIDTYKLTNLFENDKLNYEIIHFNTINSTNTFAKNQIINGKSNEFIIISDEQTNGKGRMGRRFFSNKENGLYFSVVKKNINKDFIHLLTVITASSVLNALNKLTNKRFSVKWVNDIFYNKKKICGILVENVINPDINLIDYSIIGIGINLYGEISEEEIKNIASTVEKETKTKIIKEEFIFEIINNLEKYLKNLPDKDFLTTYKENLCFKNEIIIINDFSKEYEAKLIDIDDEASLIIEVNEQRKHLNSGEVKIKSQNSFTS